VDNKSKSKALSRLVALVSDSYPVAALQKQITANRVDVLAPTASHSTVVALIDSLRAEKKLNRVQLVVVTTGREAEDVTAALHELVPNAEVLNFPSWETLPHERLSPSAETVGKRLQVLHRLGELSQNPPAHPVFVLASIRAVLQPVVAGLANHPPLKLARGSDYLLPELNLKLVEIAYERVDLVSKRGEFATRGGIIDVFPTTAQHALRLEFFGDELEEIREFSVADQRSIPLEAGAEPIIEIDLYPAREIIITPGVAARAREMAHEFPNLSTMLEKSVRAFRSKAWSHSRRFWLTRWFRLSTTCRMMRWSRFSRQKSCGTCRQPRRNQRRVLHAAWDAAIEGASAPIDLSAGGFVDLATSPTR